MPLKIGRQSAPQLHTTGSSMNLHPQGAQCLADPEDGTSKNREWEMGTPIHSFVHLFFHLIYTECLLGARHVQSPGCVAVNKQDRVLASRGHSWWSETLDTKQEMISSTCDKGFGKGWRAVGYRSSEQEPQLWPSLGGRAGHTEDLGEKPGNGVGLYLSSRSCGDDAEIDVCVKA